MAKRSATNFYGEIRTSDASDFNLKPAIRELVRTEVHPKRLELLVDRIHIRPIEEEDADTREAYRMWLSDGSCSIQAILRQNMHPFVTSREITEGSFVLLTKYQLSRGRKVKGEGMIRYLAIDDIYHIGSDGRRSENYFVEAPYRVFKTPSDPKYNFRRQRVGSPEADRSVPGVSTKRKHGSAMEGDDEKIMNITKSSPIAKETDIEKKTINKYQLMEGGIGTRTPPVESSAGPSKKRKYQLAQGSLDSIESNLVALPRQQGLGEKPLEKLDGENPVQSDDSASLLAALPILQQIKITPLARLTGAYSTRGKVHDVFVVVCSVAATIVKPRLHCMPYKRDLRITDPSTTKQVALSVFVDPANFMPHVGTVALIRNLTTHEWDGGSLNVYKTQCGGREWFLKDPVGIEGCDVEGLRHWWVSTRRKEIESEEENRGGRGIQNEAYELSAQ